MPRADFYLIDTPRFRDRPLLLVCELARKAFAAGTPAVILAGSDEQATELDDLLWSFDDDAFIPHQVAGDDDDGLAAVLIAPPGADDGGRPLAINLREGCAPGRRDRILEVIPADPAARAGSRERWKAYKTAGFTVNKHDL